MEMTTFRTSSTPARHAAVNALAIIGFIVLVMVGMLLAVYAARFVPAAVSRIGGAAVYLSSVFVSPDEDPGLVVVPPEEVIPFPEATTTPVVTTPVTTPTPTPVAGTPVTTVVPITGTRVPVTPYGLADLAIESFTTGYLTSSNTSSFVASDTVPDGKRGAFKFSVVNKGTNVADRFKFEAELPTDRAYTYHSSFQPVLNPGERIDYVLGFDRTKEGNNRTIVVTIDSGNDVRESNENNNRKSVTIDIEN